MEEEKKHTIDGNLAIGLATIGLVGLILRFIQLVIYRLFVAGNFMEYSQSDPILIFTCAADFISFLFYLSLIPSFLAICFGYLGRKRGDAFGSYALIIGVIVIIFTISIGYVR